MLEKSLRLLIGVLLFSMCVSPNALAEITAAQQAKNALEMWSPLSVSLDDGGTLAVALDQRRITDTIYNAAILYGFCGVGIISENYSYRGVKAVAILNKFSAQGYVFEGGAASCRALNEMKGREQKIRLLGMTHLH